MIHISNDSFSLIKYHVCKNNLENRKIKILYTDALKDITDILLEGISYNEEGELVLVTYLVYYEGDGIIPLKIHQNKNNITYIIFKNQNAFLNNTKSNNDSLNIFNISPLQYKHEIEGIASIFDQTAWPYFWSEYCINKFKSDPIKWSNECRYLLLCYTQRDQEKFSIQDLDLLYNKIQNNGRKYLTTIYTKESKNNLLKLNINELFLLFIKGINYKSEVQKSIEIYRPELLQSFFILKDSFLKGNIRLQEGVVIFDYIVHHFHQLTYTQICNLFKL